MDFIEHGLNMYLTMRQAMRNLTNDAKIDILKALELRPDY